MKELIMKKSINIDDLPDQLRQQVLDHMKTEAKVNAAYKPDLVDGVQWRQHPPYCHFAATPVLPATPLTNTDQWSHIEQLIARI